jgi:hypothetical protein
VSQQFLLRPLRSRRRSAVALPHSPIQRYRRLSGLGSKALSVGRGRLRRRHLEVRGPAGADPAVRSRQCHADPLQRPTQAQGLGLRDRQAINDAEGAHRPGSPPRNHHARCLETELSSRRLRRFRPISLRTGGRIELPQGATPEGGSKTTARIVLQRPTPGRLRLQPSRPAPSLPHQAPNERAENTGIPKASKPRKSIRLDPLENNIRK